MTKISSSISCSLLTILALVVPVLFPKLSINWVASLYFLYFSISIFSSWTVLFNSFTCLTTFFFIYLRDLFVSFLRASTSSPVFFKCVFFFFKIIFDFFFLQSSCSFPPCLPTDIFSSPVSKKMSPFLLPHQHYPLPGVSLRPDQAVLCCICFRGLLSSSVCCLVGGLVSWSYQALYPP